MKPILLAVFSFVLLTAQAQTTPPSANEVLNRAANVAAKEKKKILLMFTASWCGWCKRMDRSIADSSCKQYFDDNYVLVHIDVLERKEDAHLENPGGMDWLRKFKGEESGIPFWVILDSQLNLVADSYMRKPGVPLTEPGDNIGCPASEEEVQAFIKILESTSRLKKNELAIIARRFRENQR